MNHLFMKKLKNILAAVLLLTSLWGCSSTEPEIKAQSIALNQSSLTLQKGDSVTLTASMVPANAVSKVVWSSSNEKVAAVVDGKVKSLARGSATIFATVEGNIAASCNVVVNQIDIPYRLVWSDEFDGTALDLSKWSYETGGGGWGNQEKQYYTDRTDNLRFENGSLVIEAKKESFGGNNYTSARINTRNKVSFKYGKIEARMSLPVGKGSWPAFWMMGTSITTARWPLCGEIDIMEHIGAKPTMISHAVHTSEKNGSRGNNWVSQNNFNNIENSYHTYAIEWEKAYSEGADCINFYVDGTKTATIWEPIVNSTDSNWPFNSDFFILFNLAIGGVMGGTVDDAIFTSPVQMKVDYVRVYQRSLQL